MKKVFTTLFLVLPLALTGGMYRFAFASQDLADLSVGTSVHADVEVNEHSSSSNDKEDNEDNEDKDHATSSATSSHEREDDEHATSSKSENGDEHRSTVSAFVHSLLDIADREPRGIGSQVRVIAQEQNDSSTTTADAMAKTENRSGLLTFLFGSDFKNLGVIRSELAKTDNAIARLKALASSTTDVSVKADLNTQISVLEAEQAKVQAFVDAHESSFSLFGWFVKLFNK